MHYIAMDSLTSVPPGRYVVAVSGGVDSMALLDMMRQMPNVTIIAAHVDHGMRADSHKDASLVEVFCKSHNITYETTQLHLDRATSENAARIARYCFLRQCRTRHNANAIVTAHHIDDLIETVIFNLQRGTGWRGLAPFIDQEHIIRPLLDYTKRQLIDYAKTHCVPWHDDSTNSQQHYTRNYIRHTLIPLFDARSETWRQELLRHIRNQQSLRRTIQSELDASLTYVTFNRGFGGLRYAWIMLSDELRYELFQTLCRQHLGNTLIRNLAESACLFIKVARPGKVMLLGSAWQLRVTMREFIVEPRTSVVK